MINKREEIRKEMISKIDIENLENIMKLYSFVITNSDDLVQGAMYQNEAFFHANSDMSENIRAWSRRKIDLYRLMGNRTKIKIPLDPDTMMTSDLEEKTRLLFLDENGSKFNFVVREFLNSIYSSEIKKNCLSEDYQAFDKTLKKGWNITKCIAELELDEKEIRRQQDLFSMLLQAMKIQGNLVLSIDPVDFATMSVSKSGWTSCHHPNSCYGTGGLAYSTDDATMIVYVETSNPIRVGVQNSEGEEAHIEMPNKIWRSLFTIQCDSEYALMMAQYPNDSSVFEKQSVQLIKDLLEEYTGKGYDTSYVEPWEDSIALQSPNEYDLEGYTFYCDYTNENTGGDIRIIYQDKFESVDELKEAVRYGEIHYITVGNEFYCACGCNEVNYTTSFYIEEAYDNGDNDHRGNYY